MESLVKPRFSWSYSAVQMYEQCPHKYYRLRVAKDVRQDETEAMRYGTAVHKAAEEYVRDAKPVPTSYDFIKPYLDRLIKIEGEKHCEMRMGLDMNLSPVKFFHPNTWFRGIIDLAIINGDEARIIDYKTGKSAQYADKDQLELMAISLFRTMPQVKHVRAGLLFVVCNSFVKEQYDRKDANAAWARWIRRVIQIEVSMDNNVWNKTPNFTCTNCPVRDCEHWKPSKMYRRY